VQYNKITLIEKSVFLETFKQVLHQYTSEIEFHQNSQAEEILTIFFKILEQQVRNVYRFAKRVYDF